MTERRPPPSGEQPDDMPDESGGLRDARLMRALAHAPDRQQQPPAAVRSAIRDAALQAMRADGRGQASAAASGASPAPAAAPPATDARPPTALPSTRGARRPGRIAAWHDAWRNLGRAGQAAFATLLIGVVAVSLVWQAPPPGAAPESGPQASDKAPPEQARAPVDATGRARSVTPPTQMSRADSSAASTSSASSTLPAEPAAPPTPAASTIAAAPPKPAAPPAAAATASPAGSGASVPIAAAADSAVVRHEDSPARESAVPPPVASAPQPSLQPSSSPSPLPAPAPSAGAAPLRAAPAAAAVASAPRAAAKMAAPAGDGADAGWQQATLAMGDRRADLDRRDAVALASRLAAAFEAGTPVPADGTPPGATRLRLALRDSAGELQVYVLGGTSLRREQRDRPDAIVTLTEDAVQALVRDAQALIRDR